MVSSFLSFAATNQFKITFMKIGPTEIRILFIFINTMLILFGKTYLGFTLPYILGLSLVGLILVVQATGKHLHNIDMNNKK